MTLVVEIGVNQESVADFERMIDRGIDAGALLFKGQLFADRHIKGREDYNLINRAMRAEDEAQVLMDYARSRGAELFWTPEDKSMVPMCERLGVRYYKLGAKDWHRRQFVAAVGKTVKPTIQSVPLGALTMDVAIPPLHGTWHRFCCWAEYGGNPPMRKLIPELKLPTCDGASLHSTEIVPNLIGWAITGSCEVHVTEKAQSIDAAVSLDFSQLSGLIAEAKEYDIDQKLRGFGRSFDG